MKHHSSQPKPAEKNCEVPRTETEKLPKEPVPEHGKTGPQTWDEVPPEAAKAAEQKDAKESTPPPADPLEEAKRQLAELQQKFLYLQAEYQNYRKRVAKDLADVRNLSAADTLTPFLTVFDYLGMAETMADKSDNVESIRQGVKMIIAEFRKAFDELGVRTVDAVGKPFDPQFHDAVAKEPSDTVPEGTVLKQWTCGFAMGERQLRPARVVVSSGPAAEAPAEPAPGEKKEEE